MSLPILAPNDLLDLQRVSALINIDYLVVPFASSGNDIKEIRETLGGFGKTINILAKIDSIHGIENFEDILSQADGMVICRNEL